MTVDETRRLGNEFERRIQLIYPELAVSEKLNTDTIYAILSEFQHRYIKSVFISEDRQDVGNRSAARINDIAKSIIKRETLKPIQLDSTDEVSVRFDLPVDYFMYVRSNSIVDKNYKSDDTYDNPVVTPNILVLQSETPITLESYYNSKGILRNPVIVMQSDKTNVPYIQLIHDVYTNVVGLDLVYYKQPYNFNVTNYTNKPEASSVHDHCELPYSCFTDLLEGAVDMFIREYKFKLLGGSKQAQTQPNQQQEGEQ